MGATAKRFVALMTGAIDQTIELNEAAKKLNAPKRRIYDVTNVLEGRFVKNFTLKISKLDFRYWVSDEKSKKSFRMGWR